MSFRTGEKLSVAGTQAPSGEGEEEEAARAPMVSSLLNLKDNQEPVEVLTVGSSRSTPVFWEGSPGRGGEARSDQ